METEIAGAFEHSERHSWRGTAVLAIGPLTFVAAVAWALAQPYRLTMLDPATHGVWDHLAQPPLLVALVGVVFHLAVARPLVRELEGG